MTPIVVGIAGGTASGKTTVAHGFADRAAGLLLSHDRYYRDFAVPEHANFDHPDSLDTALLVTHLASLRAGLPVDVPIYDFATHRRLPLPERIEPRGVIVVEGILALVDPALRACFDLRVYVDAPDDIRFIRRLIRDVADRGRTMTGVIEQYLTTVRPMHAQFIAPCRAFADLVLDGTEGIEGQVERLATLVASR
jgi:uridine kinase